MLACQPPSTARGDAVIQIRLVRSERQLVDGPAIVDEFKAVAGDTIIRTEIVVVLEGRIALRTVFHAVEAAAAIVHRLRPRKAGTEESPLAEPLVYLALQVRCN